LELGPKVLEEHFKGLGGVVRLNHLVDSGQNCTGDLIVVDDLQQKVSRASAKLIERESTNSLKAVFEEMEGDLIAKSGQ